MSTTMTIAQALRRIKKLKGQIAEHEQRAKLNVSYDVLKVPAFSYKESVEVMIQLQIELIDLESRVAFANANNKIKYDDKEVTLSFAVRTLQELKGRISFLKGLNLRNETVKERATEWDDTELKQITRVTETVFVSDLSEKNRDSEVKALQDRFEALNNTVEDANHAVVV